MCFGYFLGVPGEQGGSPLESPVDFRLSRGGNRRERRSPWVHVWPPQAPGECLPGASGGWGVSGKTPQGSRYFPLQERAGLS